MISFSWHHFLLTALTLDISFCWHVFLSTFFSRAWCPTFDTSSLDISFSCDLLRFSQNPSLETPFFCGLFSWQQLPLDISFSGQLFILASQSDAFYLAFFLPFYLTVIIWHSIWHSVRKLIWHSVRFRRPQRSSASAFHSIPKAFTSPRCKNLSERNNDRMADNSLHFSTLLCSRLFPSLHRSSLLSSLLYILCSSVLLLNFHISQTSLLTFLDDCIYTSIYIYIHLYTSIYIYIHLYTSIYIYIHLYTSIYIYIHLYTSIYIYIQLYTSIYIYIQLYTSIYIYIQLYTSIYIYMHLYTSIHLCMYVYFLNMFLYIVQVYICI